MQPLVLLRCLGKALLKVGGQAMGIGPLGDLLGSVAGDAWHDWQSQRDEAQRRAELEAIAKLAAHEAARQAAAVVQDVAANQTAAVRQALAAFLQEVPDRLRQSWRRPEDPSGTSLPPDQPLRQPADLVRILAAAPAPPPAASPATVAAPPPARVTLTVVQGKLSGQEFAFDERTTTLIGRHEDCKPQLPNDDDHATISRHHCLLDINPPDVRIRDFGSLNATWVNGQKIGQRQRHQTPEEAARQVFPEHDLKAGDTVQLGNTIFRVGVTVTPQCSHCGTTLTGESAGGLCPACAPATADYRPAPPPGPVCAHCGQSVAGLRGTNRPGEFLCRTCQADPLALMQGLLARARAGEPDLAALNGYAFEKELGKGGMGAVGLIRHAATGEAVALKVMLPQVAVSPVARQLFLREAETTRALDHPNVVRLGATGCFQGTFFFTLEYCDGGSVDALARKHAGKLPVEEAVPIILQALDGLAYAHQRGLVHRDLKPQNLFLSGSGPARVAKVGDYGLAKAFDLAGLSGQTRTGALAGTPVFMPRQQVVNFKYAKPEVDVWALAGSLYHLLTGAFPRDFPRGRDPWQIVLQTDAVPVARRGVLLPPALAEVLDTALRDRPEIPFKTAESFRQALAGAVG